MNDYVDSDLLFLPTEEQCKEMKRIEELQRQKKERAEHLKNKKIMKKRRLIEELENGKFYCPNCGNNSLLFMAPVRGLFRMGTDDNRSQDYELINYGFVQEISGYICKYCEFYFKGNEDTFRKYLMTKNFGRS